MTTAIDTNVELAKLQRDIRSYLGLVEEMAMFEYQSHGNQVKLDLITISPRHNQSFLFHSTVGTDKVDATLKLLDYIRNFREKENSYTIQWIARGDKELHTSYFSAPHPSAALDKLYYGRDMNTINVFSVVLNPRS